MDSPDWHTANLQNNIKFTYIDSGSPQSNDYTTILCVHGHSYHAQIFKRLFPFAKQHNLRIVALNRRDYDGSSLFSPAELRVLNGPDSLAHADFLKARGSEIANFLAWLVNKENIPPITVHDDNKQSGGVVVLGWSAGNITTVAFLANMDTYPDPVRSVLDSHIRAQFIYEMNYNGLGFPAPVGAYNPLLDTSLPEHTRGLAFGTWVSSYYSHPFFASNSNGRPTMENLHARTPTKPEKPATLEMMDEDDLFDSLDLAPGSRSEHQFYTVFKHTTLHSQIVRALAPEGKGRKIPVRVVYCTATIWSIIWGVWQLETVLSKWKEEGRDTTSIEVIKVDGGNHFLHWDEPERFIDVITKAINA